MSYSIILTKRANQDIRDILAWYDEQSPSTSRSFVDELVQHLDALSLLPNSFPIAFKDVRKMVMLKLPFNIYYRIKPRKKEVVVARIWHQKRNPETLTFRQF